MGEAAEQLSAPLGHLPGRLTQGAAEGIRRLTGGWGAGRKIHFKEIPLSGNRQRSAVAGVKDEIGNVE